MTNERATSKRTRAFAYRAGVRVSGTIIACDATAGSDVIFLSHAGALPARAARALPRPRSGKRQVLTTQTTLALLGTAGERLRPHALLASLGRPFALGPLRLELFPSGYMPGAASLRCELGARRLVYTGPLGNGRSHGATTTAGAPAVYPADAVCLDATFGARRYSFPDPVEALAELVRFATGAVAAGRTPVVLVDIPGPALDAADALAAAGLALRAHRSVMASAAAFRGAGLPAPALQRFEDRLRPGEALLWPLADRHAARLRTLAAREVLLASPSAVDPDAVSEAGAARGVAYSNRADFAGLLEYVDATGATEVALMNAPGDDLMLALRERGIDAYVVGPPRQITLFQPTGAAAPA